MNVPILLQKVRHKESLCHFTSAMSLDVFPMVWKDIEAKKARQPSKIRAQNASTMVPGGSMHSDELSLWHSLALWPLCGAHPCLTGNPFYAAHSLWVTVLWLPVNGSIYHSFIPYHASLTQALRVNDNRLSPCLHRIDILGMEGSER